MKKARITIGNKILGGFFIIVIFFVANVVYSVITTNQNNSRILWSSEVIDPSVSYLKEFKLLVTKSKMLITNWVYLQSNVVDKDALKNLHNFEYPTLKEDLGNLIEVWDNPVQASAMDSIFGKFEDLLKVEKGIMEELVTFENYEDPVVKFMAEDAIESEVLPQSTTIIDLLEKVIVQKEEEAKLAGEKVISSSHQLGQTTIVLGVLITIIGLVVGLYMSKSITKPIKYLKGIIDRLGHGDLPENQSLKVGNDEIGEMANSVKKLVNGLKSTSHFAENIGKGNYQSEFKPLSENDVLGNALIEMRNNLQKVAEEDKRRNWATEGLAKFGEILRKNNDNLNRLSDEIISNLIKYLKANQGGLFIINEDENKEAYLSLAACYAWDKKKYLEQKIFIGEGLTGQAWLEKDTIYLTEIPENYINITSGLGDANPSSILIVPLKVNDEIYGVIEIASFNKFVDYEREFIEKIAESIASTISSVKINETTQKLLEESTEMTEQMRAQEEEMRQNMEELQATQEEMERNNREREAKEKIVDSSNLIFELDDEFRLISFNQVVKDVLHLNEGDLSGKFFSNFVSSQENLNQAIRNLKDGMTWTGILKIKGKGSLDITLKVSAGRTSDNTNSGHKYLLYGMDISSVFA